MKKNPFYDEETKIIDKKENNLFKDDGKKFFHYSVGICMIIITAIQIYYFIGVRKVSNDYDQAMEMNKKILKDLGMYKFK